MRYEIHITLSNGDSVKARAIGRNREEAFARMEATQQYKDFVGTSVIKSIQFHDLPPEEPTDPERFALTERDGICTVVDLDNGIRIDFTEGDYNGTQKVTRFGDKRLNEIEAATALREIGDWMAEYFPNKI